jgi:hypothetical protein
MKKTLLLRGALLPLFLTGCGSREEGTRLLLELAHRSVRAAQVEGLTRHFTNDRGDRITLTRAYVTLGSVEIIPCPEPAALRWLRTLSPVGTAHAHTESSPRRLGTPYVSGLERPDGEPLPLGLLRPPPGLYCRAHLVFAPADADAEGLPADGSMEGKTLVLEGGVVPVGEEALRPFRLESSGVANAQLPLEQVSLSPEDLESEQRITLHYDRWLDGTSPLATDAATQVLRNVASSTSIESSP